MANNIFTGVNACIPKLDFDFADMGVTPANTIRITKYMNGSLYSYDPSRSINAISGFETGNWAYRWVAKINMDMTAYVLPDPSPLNQPVFVYFILGQSNAFGFGNHIDTLTAPLNAPIPNVYIYYKPLSTTDNNAAYSADNGDWEQLSTENNQLNDYLGTYYGAELKFGYEMQNYLNIPIYIIKYSIGDTALQNESTAGVIGAGGLLDWSPSSVNEMYKRTVTDYWTVAKAKLVADGKVPVAKGLLWMQGERDAFYETFADNYEANLINFLTTLRNDLGAKGMTCCIARISNDTAAIRAFGPEIRTAQANVAALYNNVLINTDPYAMQPDLSHYTDPSELGQDFYLAMRDV